MAAASKKPLAPRGAILRFDRGTLLLEGAPALEAPAPGLLWDPRVAAHRAPACCYAELSDRLPGVTDAVAAGRGRSLPVAAPDLRPYQRHALTAWDVMRRRGVVALPTGSGKTHVAVAAMAQVARPAVVLVPTRALLAQWAALAAGFCDGPVGVVGDGAWSVEALTLCTFEAAYHHMDLFGGSFALLVVDEAHHLGGTLRPEALEMCAAPARLGLTAVPPTGQRAVQRMEQLLGPLVYRATVAELSGRHLAPYDRVPILVHLSDDERAAYTAAYNAYIETYAAFTRLGRGGGFAALQRFASASAAGRRGLRGLTEARRVVATARAKREVVARLLARHHDEPVLVFTGDNAAAYALSRELLIPAVTCRIKRAERVAVLEGLRDGRYRAVVSARVLNEGLDLPDCRVGIVTGGSQGVREHVQRLGRLLRPAPDKRALLYEVLARETFEVEHARQQQLALADA